MRRGGHTAIVAKRPPEGKPVPKRRRGGPEGKCSEHPGAWVVSKGRRHTKHGTVQVFACEPGTPASHKFSVLLEAESPVPVRSKRAGPAPAVCPRPEHVGSKVVSKGVVARQSGSVRRFYCTPVEGRGHWFGLPVVVEPVAVEGTGLADMSGPGSKPLCPEHPTAHVVRDGRYAISSTQKRQRYRCYPTGKRDEYHRFTPALPRTHVHPDSEPCAECEEHRGIHRGDTTVSRRQSWSARVVAETLRELARGRTYSEASVSLRTMTKRRRTRKQTGPAPTGRNRSAGTRRSRNAWHIAADWCEIYSPVLWDDMDAMLRARTARLSLERDRLAGLGQLPAELMVLVIDDVPVNARFTEADTTHNSRRDYYVLAAAEVYWGDLFDDRLERDLRLRLVRAYPSNDHHAWKLVFDELGYTPDVIIADAGTGLMKAIDDYYGSSVLFIPSLFHIRVSVEDGLLATPGAWTRPSPKAARELHPDIRKYLVGLSRKQVTTVTVEEWSAWWDGLEALLTGLEISPEVAIVRRKLYEDQVAKLLPTLATHPHVPLSTGGLEVKIRRKIDPILAGRSHAFANLERTNRLLDLVVCEDHQLFSDMGHVVSLLRADSTDHGGWSTPLRMVADLQPPGKRPKKKRPYSSLRDQVLLRDLARKKGLA